MNIEALLEKAYKISFSFSPPRMTLRDGRITDDYGETNCATRILKHKLPEDVVYEDYDYYTDTFSFISGYDVLFYFYSVVKIFESDPNDYRAEEQMDSLLYNLDSRSSALIGLLGDKFELFKEVMLEIYSRYSLKVDWIACMDLQKLLGIPETTELDEQKHWESISEKGSL